MTCSAKEDILEYLWWRWWKEKDEDVPTHLDETVIKRKYCVFIMFACFLPLDKYRIGVETITFYCKTDGIDFTCVRGLTRARRDACLRHICILTECLLGRCTAHRVFWEPSHPKWDAWKSCSHRLGSFEIRAAKSDAFAARNHPLKPPYVTPVAWRFTSE